MPVDTHEKQHSSNGQRINGHYVRRTMLSPVAYDESVMPALRLARSSRISRRIAKVLFFSLIGTTVFMTFAPWQQSVSGSGNVLAFSPDQRQQVIESPIEGRIVYWPDEIVENSVVKEGQLLVEIQDLDKSLKQRLENQVENAELGVEAAKQQLQADKDAKANAVDAVKVLTRQVATYEKVKERTEKSQNSYVEMAEKKVKSVEAEKGMYEAAIFQLEEQNKRVAKLAGKDNLSVLKAQEAARKLMEAKLKVTKAEFDVAAAKAELEGKKDERYAKIEKAQADIEYANSQLQKAHGDVSKANSYIAKSEQELNKAKQDLIEKEHKLARYGNGKIYAPFDGYVVQINPNRETAVLKKGDPICTIVPKTEDRSVQIWLDGNDAPLVEPGRHVRLQFEGWPALQFAGWPSVAVGTFGGEVVSVDATDNGQGKFRVLIKPDTHDNKWPEERFLKQGVRANGWVLLKRVPLWFEVWRQLNGFPPVISMEKEGGKDIKNKPPKLPK